MTTSSIIVSSRSCSIKACVLLLVVLLVAISVSPITRSELHQQAKQGGCMSHFRPPTPHHTIRLTLCWGSLIHPLTSMSLASIKDRWKQTGCLTCESDVCQVVFETSTLTSFRVWVEGNKGAVRLRIPISPSWRKQAQHAVSHSFTLIFFLSLVLIVAIAIKQGPLCWCIHLTFSCLLHHNRVPAAAPTDICASA